MKLTRQQAKGWLAGFMDGEGCVWFQNRRCKASRQWRSARVICVSNTERKLIQVASRCLSMLGIFHCVYGPKRPKAPRRPFWTIEIRRCADMERFRKLVPIQSVMKSRKLKLALKFALGLYCHGCGCLHDKNNPQCRVCKIRHYFRRKASEARTRKP